ncbi:MAG: FAD-linked oxidase C-terminal domain-containing protein, partial [Waddliaceae bacterium]
MTFNGKLIKDPITRSVYSVDASIYEVCPEAVYIPESIDDLIQVVKHVKTVIPRGAATGITGGCLGEGVVIDLSKHFTAIEKISNESVECEPGVIQDDLNHALPKGYRLGPDTSTGNRATLGGMLANNAAGSHSLVYGSMRDHILSVDLLMSTGEIITFEEIDIPTWEQKAQRCPIHQALLDIRNKKGHLIKEHFPKLPRRVSGYNLDELIRPDRVNLAKLIAGSEGTLGIITKMKLKVSKALPESGLRLLPFHSIEAALDQAANLLEENPFSIELIDENILKAVRKPLPWLKEIPKALLVVEYPIDNENLIKDPETIQSIWAVRKAGLGLLLSKRSYQRAIAFIEDISVPPKQLSAFMKELLPILGHNAGVYGHAGAGCLHIRPYIDLRKQDELLRMRSLMDATARLVKKFSGAMSGEHGDGLIRTWLNEQMFGKDLYDIFIQVKRAFDPLNKMNPGKIVDGPPLEENLRLSPATKINQIETKQTFDGGFSLAVDLCNGNGQCRKKEGIMCPSFQVTNSEFHSTRARAQALRSIINGKLPLSALASKEMYKVMELCISCKGCKTECPSHIDMAKMKSEFLYHYYKKHSPSLRDRLFAHLPDLYPYIYPFRALANKMPLHLLGIAKDKPLPPFSKQRFSSYTLPKLENPKGTVVLYNDTFTEFHNPEIGLAAISILQKLEFEVIVPPWTCCSRPSLSKGFLDSAFKKGERVKEMLAPYAHLPIIGLEPSCLFTLRDDLDIKCLTLEEFLLPYMDQLSIQSHPQRVSLHTHCHQKSLIGEDPTLQLLKKVPGLTVDPIPSGCCGMA